MSARAMWVPAWVTDPRPRTPLEREPWVHTRIYLDPLDTAGLARVYGAEEMQAEQQRSEMYADLVRRTAEALGMKMADGWHGLPERAASLRDALYAADRLMGHDDEQTDWRERWARLWG